MIPSLLILNEISFESAKFVKESTAAILEKRKFKSDTKQTLKLFKVNFTLEQKLID